MEGKLGGEVRRLHIIYFLSHMGHVEQPHLVRVHHFTRTGVYLRDVKRWLGDLRGKDMPEAYAWSYKRRYKTGYVWQDLADDDLITPLSDNEYVLKGSQIISTPTDEKRDSRSFSCAEKKATNDSTYKENSNQVTKTDHHHHQTVDKVQPEKTTTTNFFLKESHKKICPDSKIDPPSKIFSEINEESSSSASSERSTLTDDFDSVMLSLSNNNSLPMSTSDHKRSKNKKKKKTAAGAGTDEEGGMGCAPAGGSTRLSSSSSKSPLPAKRKSFSSGGASNVIRNFITCGAVDTNDKVLVMVNGNRRSGGGQNDKSNDNKARDEFLIKGDHHGHFGRSSSSRVFRACWDHQEEIHQPHRHSTSRSCDERKGPEKQQTDFSKQRAIPASYRPVGEPNCSQCGKTFKPEKMHSHMKSCRGMKALAGKSTSSFAPITPTEKNEKRDSRSFSCAEKKATNDSIYEENSNQVTKTDHHHHQTEDKVQPEKTTTTNFFLKESHKKICPDSKIDPPSKIFSEINEESSSSASSERSTLTDDFDSVKLSLSNNNSLPMSTSDHKRSKNKKKKKTAAGAGTDEEGGMGCAPAGGSTHLSSSSSKSPLPAKRKSFPSGGASNVIRNFITCGAVDTNDKVLVMVNGNRRSGGGQNDKSNDNKARDEFLIKGDHHGHFGRSSSSRVFRACWDHQEEIHQPHRHSTSRSCDERKGPEKRQTDFSKQRAIPASYRPFGEPNCSQCGKTFKPEKMHSHMKSCRGMKALAGKSTSSFAPITPMEKSTAPYHSQQGSTNTSYKESALAYFLTN